MEQGAAAESSPCLLLELHGCCCSSPQAIAGPAPSPTALPELEDELLEARTTFALVL